jgi:hypothetical protein
MKSLLVLFLVAASVAEAQNKTLTASSCTVIATLASSKRDSGSDGNFIVIWYFNRGSKPIHGVEFHLVMLDAVGNRYPASQAYQARGTVKQNNGDLVMFPSTEEAKYFGANWDHIDGVEVYVASLLFADATVWTPGKGVSCKASFLNDAYDKEIERIERVQQQRNAKPKNK